MVGRVQRAVEIREKRAEDENLRPPEPQYATHERTQVSLLSAQDKHLVKRNYLDLVECTHRNPDTEEQIAYTDYPETRLPGADLSQDHLTQSKAITHMGTTRDMFKGTAKALEDRPVGYSGHVPQHERNMGGIHENDPARVYSKSYMTLATHGGGVDASVTENNLRAKHRSGRNAPPATSLKPKSDETIAQTTEGRLLQTTHQNVTKGEANINVRDDKQSQNYF
ncbi:hypothetical protein AGDE_03543 [Angomonas deanei]|nr:hypothetical protein AGDE_03543 [Angomonas deanei]|eukprot:EPY40385.1 hypothetical protein AGDE_03543 [Angomonas deanei]